MKTGASLGQLSLSLIFCLGLTACNQDDFYEKEFLDNPYKDEATTGGSTDGSTSGGDQGGSTAGTGSTQGGVDSGVTGGTTSGSTTGSTTSGSTTGSTTSGSTTGSTTSGSTTGSTTSGSTTGSTTSGSTTGSTTSGGTTGTSVEETFNQSAEQTKKVDIVWIIDDSGSMADEQTSLGTNFSSFIDEFVDRNVDFKMAITTTDTTPGRAGRIVPNSDMLLTSAKAQANENGFKNDFRNLIRVGTSGSGYEKGLEASEAFMTNNASFLRSDAYLAVVIVSDEEDQSARTPVQYANLLKATKSTAGLVKVYSIVDTTLSNCCQSGVSTGFQRYADVSNETAGAVGDIRGNFARVLGDIGDSIINLLDSFALAHDPLPGTLEVRVNGTLSHDYTFDAASRSIKFSAGNLPPVGAQIKVNYQR